jgi:hypothetical protein
MCLLEYALKISDAYLASYASFGTSQPCQDTFNRLRSIVDSEYGDVLSNTLGQHLLVDSSVANRAKEITFANLEQYKLLLFVDKDDGRNWNVIPGGPIRYTSMPASAIDRNYLYHQGSSSSVAEKPSRREINLIKKANPLKVNVLLHDSIIFLKSGLYIDRKLKNASSILDKTLLPELVAEGLLLSVAHGVLGTWNKPTVYIKTLPGGNITREHLELMLTVYGDSRLTIETYLEKCSKIQLQASGRLSGEVLDIFDRKEYKVLQMDLTPLINLQPSELKGVFIFIKKISFIDEKFTKNRTTSDGSFQ